MLPFFNIALTKVSAAAGTMRTVCLCGALGQSRTNGAVDVRRRRRRICSLCEDPRIIDRASFPRNNEAAQRHDLRQHKAA
jgi:hypothetical protein